MSAVSNGTVAGIATTSVLRFDSWSCSALARAQLPLSFADRERRQCSMRLHANRLTARIRVLALSPTIQARHPAPTLAFARRVATVRAALRRAHAPLAYAA